MLFSLHQTIFQRMSMLDKNANKVILFLNNFAADCCVLDIWGEGRGRHGAAKRGSPGGGGVLPVPLELTKEFA
jgi:hypothetical protein